MYDFKKRSEGAVYAMACGLFLEKHTRSVVVMKKKREEAGEVFIYAAGSHGIMRSMVCFEKRSREADHAISRCSL
jgi:hypothetical protein